MSIRLNNVQIENCGTGIKANGKVNIEMTNMTFKDNGKDIDLYVEEGSQISVDELISTGCRTESITYEEYSTKIIDVKSFIEGKTEYFTIEEIGKIKGLLDEMENAKEQPTKIQEILKELSQVGKSTASGLLLAYLKTQLGW